MPMNMKQMLLLTVAVLTLERTALAQFSLKWFTIDGGGNASSGGAFTLQGATGQPDAAPLLTGASFKLEPGFWNGVTVYQTPGAPLLQIKLIGGGLAVLSWPVAVSGFTLQQSATVGQLGSWNAAPYATIDTATEHTVTVPAAGLKCFRLMKP